MEDQYNFSNRKKENFLFSIKYWSHEECISFLKISNIFENSDNPQIEEVLLAMDFKELKSHIISLVQTAPSIEFLIE